MSKMQAMIRRSGPLAPLLVALLLAACARASEPERPGVLVLIVVDQLRADLLDRYEGALSGGFARLLREGAHFAHTEVAHAVTNSAPGHATLATGAYPSTHGIVDNQFWERMPRGWRFRSAVLDEDARILGSPDATAYSSTSRLVSALGDWARSADSTAHVVSIGQAPHNSNMLAPLEGGAAYWFSGGASAFVTSSHYVSTYPDFVERFNRATLPRLLADSTWTLTVPDSARQLAVADDVPWEARAHNPTFPHGFVHDLPPERRLEAGAFEEWFASSPGLDRAILALAEVAVRENGLGDDDAVDVLTINLSSLDEAGHAYGPFSLEQLDALLRLDRELDAFLSFLDRTVGEGRWALALSADHGAATPPGQRLAEGGDAALVPQAAVDSAFARIREQVADADSAARFAVAERILESLPFVSEVYSVEQLAARDAGEVPGLLRLHRNSFHPDRRVDFPIRDGTRETAPMHIGIGAIRMTEGAMMDFATSIHGSPWRHDREVPFLLLGPDVEPGVRPGVETVDVAPSLASLGGLTVPAWVDGRSVTR